MKARAYKMKWNKFIEELSENVDADEQGNEKVTLLGLLTYAGLFKIEGAEKYWNMLLDKPEVK
jgi:preprotein translocase subunit SecB